LLRRLGEVCWFLCLNLWHVREFVLDILLVTAASESNLVFHGEVNRAAFSSVDSKLIHNTAPYIIQAILGLVLATTPLILPQSPRWLLLHNHRQKAIQALKSLDFSAVEAEKDLLGPAAEQQMSIRQPGPVEGLTMLFRKPYRKPALLALYVLGVIQLSGIDGVL
jgi:hypothetical protein